MGLDFVSWKFQGLGRRPRNFSSRSIPIYDYPVTSLNSIPDNDIILVQVPPAAASSNLQMAAAEEGDHDLDEETLAKIEAERKKEKRAAYMRMSRSLERYLSCEHIAMYTRLQ